MWQVSMFSRSSIISAGMFCAHIAVTSETLKRGQPQVEKNQPYNCSSDVDDSYPPLECRIKWLTISWQTAWCYCCNTAIRTLLHLHSTHRNLPSMMFNTFLVSCPSDLIRLSAASHFSVNTLNPEM